jgi:hypothetical protein
MLTGRRAAYAGGIALATAAAGAAGALVLANRARRKTLRIATYGPPWAVPDSLG